MTDTTTATQTRRQRREAAENAARLDAKGRAAKTGRTAGVVLGASGLILSTSVSATAVEVAPADEGRVLTTVALDAQGALERVSATQPTSITASENLQLTFERPAVSTESAPEPEPEPEPAVQAVTAETTTEAPATEQAWGTEEQATAEQPAETQQYDQHQQDNGETAATTETETYEEPQQEAPATNSSVVSTGYTVLGTPYVWAGSSLSGMDCSGFINWVYRQHGISLPRSTHGMLASLPRVSTPQPGDIVISTGIRSQYHAGIYAGNGQMLSSMAARGVTTHGYHDGWHNVVAILRPA